MHGVKSCELEQQNKKRLYGNAYGKINWVFGFADNRALGGI